MDNTTKKENWTYLIFFLMGILSFPISRFLEVLLESTNIFIIHIILDGRQILFTFFIYSIFFTIGLYALKRTSPLKTFAITVIASILVYQAASSNGALVGSILRGLLGSLPIYLNESLIGPFIFLIILLTVGLNIFKGRPLINFSIKAFAVSFTPLFLIISVWFIIAMSGGGVFISVQEVYPSDGIRYAEITEEEWNNYPLLRQAIDEYTVNRTQLSNVDYEKWNRTRDFIGKKQRESRLLFSIMDAELEKKLTLSPPNRSISPMKLKNTALRLKNIFQSNGYNLSEYAYIDFAYEKWVIFEKQYLFGIIDAELENDLNKIPFRMGGELRKEDINREVKLKEAFESKGFSLSENHWLHRSPENWVIIEESGNIYEIWNEDGMFNFYTQDKLTYELWKEDAKLNVYDGKYREPITKIGGKYYMISFGHYD